LPPIASAAKERGKHPRAPISHAPNTDVPKRELALTQNKHNSKHKQPLGNSWPSDPPQKALSERTVGGSGNG